MTALFLFAILAAILALAYVTAPEGYQNETGFHFGKDPRNDRA